jgi:hypothetical protein
MWFSMSTTMFDNLPENAHVFVVSYESDPAAVAEDIEFVEGYVDTWLNTLSDDDRAKVEARFHYVTEGIPTMSNILAEKQAYYSGFSVAIDRYQRWRDVGGLYELNTFGPDINMLGYDAEYYNYEWERDHRLDAETDVTEVTVVDGVEFGWQTFDVELPDAATMATFDSLEIELESFCKEDPADYPNNWTCGEWDYNAELYLCDVEDPDVCSTIVARWITPYGRYSKWAWDVTPMMALFADGGTRRFAINNANVYTSTMRLRMRDNGATDHPAEAVYLWGGGNFDATYNDAHLPIEVDIPADVTRVELVADITGHGFGADAANCAEFCNHQHEFTVNGGTPHLHENPAVYDARGCEGAVSSGVVPNQYGTWWYGRGGWCPGWVVEPVRFDITAEVTPGAKNTIAYRGLFEGEPPYTPLHGGGNIYMNSWLVFWRD